MDELSAKQQIIMHLKSQVYDQIALKEQAENTIRSLNEQIARIANQPESPVPEEDQHLNDEEQSSE